MSTTPTVKGFGVRGQERTTIRKDLKGTYQGLKWFVMGDGPGRFRWSIGPLGGFVSPNAKLRDALIKMKEAYRRISRLTNLYGIEAVKTSANELETLMKWEQVAAEGRLRIKAKPKKDGSIVWKVWAEPTSVTYVAPEPEPTPPEPEKTPPKKKAPKKTPPKKKKSTPTKKKSKDAGPKARISSKQVAARLIEGGSSASRVSTRAVTKAYNALRKEAGLSTGETLTEARVEAIKAKMKKMKKAR
jgi:hypothetical protein